MRAVLCMRAYKKLTGLYDLSVLVATVDAPRAGVQGRFDAEGVSFDNALALSDHYLKGFGMDASGGIDDGRCAMKLAIVEVLDRDGHARLIVPVMSWPVTIGRAIDCDVVLDDAHAAARHATLTGVGSVIGGGEASQRG